MTSKKLKYLILMMILLIFSCSSERGTKNKNIPQDVNSGAEETAQVDNEKGEIRNMTGTIIFQEIEGGFYGIKADDGQKYNPLNLDESYRKDGLRVKFDANLKEGMVGIHMWGEYVEIVKIEELSEIRPE